MKSLLSEERKLARWASKQRTDYKLGKLKQWQIEKLESLPGWSWNEN